MNIENRLAITSTWNQAQLRMIVVEVYGRDYVFPSANKEHICHINIINEQQPSNGKR